VALERQQGVVAVHSLAVIGDADQLSPAALNLHANARRSGIESVLKQLLDHRRGPIHHLAGGNLVGNLIGKDADLAHKNSG
jgi:hypothetical protein